MYCMECGYENSDRAKFCRNCGAPIEIRMQPVPGGFEEPENTPPVYYDSEPAPVYGGPYDEMGSGDNQAVFDGNGRVISPWASELVRKNTGSAVFLIGTILFSLAVILEIVFAFTDTETAEAVIDLLGGGIPTSLVAPYIAAITIISGIPAILTALALWITYAAAKSAHGEPMGTGGLTFLKAMAIFRIIIAALVMFIIILAAAIALSSSMLYILTAEIGISAAEAVSLRFIVWGAVAGVIIAEVLMIIYYAKSIAFINGARSTLNKGFPAGKKPVFVPVFSFIIAALCLVEAAYSFIMLSGMTNAVTSLLTGIVYILFGVSAISYRKKWFKISQ